MREREEGGARQGGAPVPAGEDAGKLERGAGAGGAWQRVLHGSRLRALRTPLQLLDCLVSMARTKALGRIPERPWFPYDLQSYLWRELPPGARVFEWGSGGSTIWLARAGFRVQSVEHVPAWTRKVRRRLGELGLAERVGIETRESTPAKAHTPPRHRSGDDDHRGRSFRDYVRSIDAFPDGHFRLIVVDGRARCGCVLRSPPKLAEGGLLILDDSDRPRYRDAVRALDGWPRRDFRGLQPFKLRLEQATVWRKPVGGTAEA